MSGKYFNISKSKLSVRNLFIPEPNPDISVTEVPDIINTCPLFASIVTCPSGIFNKNLCCEPT